MSLQPWVMASRPKTLPAALVPVLVGSGLAASVQAFSWLPALLCGLFSLVIQIGTNFANDYYDWKQGADTEERTGPTRAVASGQVAPGTMKTVAFATLATGFLIGLTLVYWGGWWLVLVGLLSVVSAIAYTAKPIALGYRGLGDIFVVGFFGFVAVGFTTYVQIGYFPPSAWPTGLAIGLLANNLLVVNNYRDRESDAKAGKRTLIVRFGPSFGEALVLTSLCFSAFLCLGFALIADQWMPLIALPGLLPIYKVWKRMPRALRREGFNRLLQMSALGLLLFGILLSIGLFLS